MFVLFGSLLSPTKAAGLAAYALAAFTCGTALRRPGCRSLFAAGAAIDLYLLADILWDLRWRLHDSLEDGARSLGLYDSRFAPQVACVALIALAFVLTGAWQWKQWGGQPGCRIAAMGLAFSMGLWGMEVISLHASDAFLDRRIGPFAVVALGWMLAGALTAGGALWETARANR